MDINNQHIESNEYPYSLLDEYTTKIDSYDYILVRKSLINKFFDMEIEYKKIHKQTLLIFIILLKLIDSTKYTRLSQKELAATLHINESTMTRGMNFLNDKKIIDIKREYGKSFKFTRDNNKLDYIIDQIKTECKDEKEALKFYMINDFENHYMNNNKYFNANLYFTLLACSFIKEDEQQRSYYYKIGNEFRHDEEIRKFFAWDPEEYENKLFRPSNYIPRDMIPYYAEEYTKLSDEKKQIIKQASDENTTIRLITQGENYILIDKNVIDYMIFLYRVNDYDIPKGALYVFLYIIMKLDSYNYVKLDRKELMDKLNLDKSTVSNAFIWLKKNNIIEQNLKNKKEYKFMSDINDDDYMNILDNYGIGRKLDAIDVKDFIYWDFKEDMSEEDYYELEEE